MTGESSDWQRRVARRTELPACGGEGLKTHRHWTVSKLALKGSSRTQNRAGRQQERTGRIRTENRAGRKQKRKRAGRKQKQNRADRKQEQNRADRKREENRTDRTQNLLAHERVTESGHEEMMIEREMSEAGKKESWAPPPGRTTCRVTELTRSMMRITHSIGLCMPFHCAVVRQKRTCVNGYMNQRLWLRSLACCVRKASNIVMLLLLTLMPCMVVSNAIEMLVGSWNLYALMWLLLRR